MSRKHRAVTPESIDNPERGMELEDRGVLRAPEAEEPEIDETPRPPTPPEEDEPEDDPEAGLRGRLKALREALPPAPQGSCRACFQRGARATLDAIDDHGSLRGQIAAIRKNQPTDTQPHSAADFKSGIAAILEGIKG